MIEHAQERGGHGLHGGRVDLLAVDVARLRRAPAPRQAHSPSGKPLPSPPWPPSFAALPSPVPPLLLLLLLSLRLQAIIIGITLTIVASLPLSLASLLGIPSHPLASLSRAGRLEECSATAP